MSKNRIKLTNQIIHTRALAEAAVREIVELKIAHQTATLEMDEAITNAKKKFEGTLSALEKDILIKTTMVQMWAESNPLEFTASKSIDMTHAVVGFRTGQPTLKTLAGWTWDRVLEKLNAIGLDRFVRIKSEVNKAQLLSDRDTLGADQLKSIGVRVVQDEAFFIEPKLTETENRITAAA